LTISADFQNKPQAFCGVPGLAVGNVPAGGTRTRAETIPDPSASLKTPAVLHPHLQAGFWLPHGTLRALMQVESARSRAAFKMEHERSRSPAAERFLRRARSRCGGFLWLSPALAGSLHPVCGLLTIVRLWEFIKQLLWP